MSKNYLSNDPKEMKKKNTPVPRSSGKYFMVQNIATEKLRVYKKMCNDNSCDHLMVMEADMAVGEDKKRTRTVLGNFKITKWHKFYQDKAGSYPSWYKRSYPMPPGPGEGVMEWTKDKYMPNGGSARGAFGWYTAHVGPRASYQWTHGTLGWGSDGNKYIDATREMFANIFTDPRSHGCTRVNNEVIAYVRHLMPQGATIVKIYATEGLKDSSLARYPEKRDEWNYILTKKSNQKADRDEVVNAGTANSEILEEGIFEIDKRPSVISRPPFFLNGPFLMRKLQKGNVYGVSKRKMKGVFAIDTGKVINYRHPSELRVGGSTSVSIPSFMRSNGKQSRIDTSSTEDSSSNSASNNDNDIFGEDNNY